VAEEMMEDLETEFVSGDGQLNATKGFLSYLTADTADGVRPFGTLQFIKTGVDGNLAALDADTGVSPADKLIDLQTALKEKHHAGAIWLMNRSVKGTVRKIKDNDGNYVWQPRLTLSEPETLLGYQLRTSHAMPAAATNSLSIAFGDFKRGITIVIRPGMYVVRDNVTKAPNIRFVFSKRYGLMLRNSEAIKLLKFAA
jgi:HK97 family phage major capsid protein